MTRLSRTLRRRVFERAEHRCEYCQTSRRILGMSLVVDHIVPRSKGGSDDLDNLSAACYRCNEYKSARMHARDPVTGELVDLFNPRRDAWDEHFAWANGGTHIVGLTAVGRATILALRLNNEYVVEARTIWISFGWHPPKK